MACAKKDMLYRISSQPIIPGRSGLFEYLFYVVKIDDELVRDEKIFSKKDKRSLKGQIEHWVRIGKCSEENPDLTYHLIKDILIGLEEMEQGELSEYKFG